MKRIVCVLSLLVLSVCTSLAGKNTLDVNVSVVDQDGVPVEGASVQIGFQPLGSGGSSKRGKTNEKGVYIAEGESNLQYWVSVTKNGYYGSRLDRQEVKKEVKPRKWEIVDQYVSFTLRKIKNPVPMYAKVVLALDIPTKGKEIGFDLEEGDWVSPYGSGKKSDLLISADGHYNSSKDKESKLRLTFANPHDGFIFSESISKESAFISPYDAPLSGYQLDFEGRKATISPEGGRPYKINDLEKHDVILFRIRTVLDKNGGIKEAQYGKIYDGFKLGGGATELYCLSFTYYLNANTNDRNLEYSVSDNLIKNLKKSEEPKKP